MSSTAPNFSVMNEWNTNYFDTKTFNKFSSNLSLLIKSDQICWKNNIQLRPKLLTPLMKLDKTIDFLMEMTIKNKCL